VSLRVAIVGAGGIAGRHARAGESFADATTEGRAASA
jgi:predicted dehydrogenase